MIHTASVPGLEPGGQFLHICRICGLVHEVGASSGDQPSVWSTLKDYRGRCNVPPSQLYFTQTYCPDCARLIEARAPEHFQTGKTKGLIAPDSEAASENAETGLIAVVGAFLSSWAMK